MSLPTDVPQQPRIQNGVVDIGACEGALVAPQAVVEVPALGGGAMALFIAALAAVAALRLRLRPAPRRSSPGSDRSSRR